MRTRIRRSAEREVRDREFEEERGEAAVDRETIPFVNAQRKIDDAVSEHLEKGGR